MFYNGKPVLQDTEDQNEVVEVKYGNRRVFEARSLLRTTFYDICPNAFD